jgi:integrase
MAARGRVTGHIRPNKGKRGTVWYARIRQVDEHGQVHQLHRALGEAWTGKGRPPAGYLSKRAAKEMLDELIVKVRNGEVELRRRPGEPPAAGPTFAQAAEAWLWYLENVKKDDWSTVKDYAAVIRLHLGPEFGERPLGEISSKEIKAYAERKLAEGRLSPRSITRHLVVLHGTFERAEIEPNPASAKRVPRPRPKDDGDYSAYEPDELKLLAAAAASDRQFATLLLTAAYTGMRQGELIALTWGDVDFLAGLLYVRRSWSSKEGRMKTTKGKRMRSVPLIADAEEALARLKERERFTENGDWVFIDSKGDRLDAARLRRQWYATRKRADVPKLRFHDLRHTLGTIGARAWDPYTLQAYMGHQDASTTARYVHRRPRRHDAEVLQRAFDEGASPPISPPPARDARVNRERSEPGVTESPQHDGNPAQ